MTRAETAVCTAVSPMSGSPTFDIDKIKNRNGANLRLRHALRAGGVKMIMLITPPAVGEAES